LAIGFQFLIAENKWKEVKFGQWKDAHIPYQHLKVNSSNLSRCSFSLLALILLAFARFDQLF